MGPGVLADDSPAGASEAGPGAAAEREWSNLALLLITVVLVVAGLVLLVVGYVDGSMTILYASIGCAAAAGVVLIVFTRLNRRRAVEAAAGSEPGPGGDQPGERPAPN